MAKSPSALTWLPLLELAAQEQIGVLLRSNNPGAALVALRAARAESQDPRFAAMQFRALEHPEGNVAIVWTKSKPGVATTRAIEDLGL